MNMDAQCWVLSRPSSLSHSPAITGTVLRSCPNPNRRRRRRSAAAPARIRAVVGKAAAEISSAPVEITWQIAVGAVAGITPFVVAGIEFSKRIVAQRRCEVCKGSGLVLKDAFYVRCPGCGGFLPWQSWKRFFTG